MKKFINSISLIILAPLALMAGAGDNIRGIAPTTALIFDAREGNAGPLKEAYLDDEIDFFLDFEQPKQKIVLELAYLREAGRAINQSDYAKAEQYIRSIQGFNTEKKYLRAVLDGAQGRYQQSLEGFRQLIDGRSSISSRRLISLAFMGAARIFHEIGDYKQAIYHYNQIHQLDSQFFQAVFEKGWSFYLNGDMNGSLGATLTFLSPYFENAFYPETMLVRAASFFQLCYFERATKTVAQTKQMYEPIQRQIRGLLTRDPRSWLFDERMLKGVHPSVLGALVFDSRYRSRLRAQINLTKEIQKLGNRPEQHLAAQALSTIKSLMVDDAQRVLRLADKQISDILAQMDMIAIEILQASANQVLGLPPEEQAKVKIIDLGSVDFDPKVQFWPFKGEFWVDELGSYYYGLKSNCENPNSQSIIKSMLYADVLRYRPAQKAW